MPRLIASLTSCCGSRLAVMLIVALGLLCASTAVPAMAQSYKQYPVDTKLSRKGSVVKRYVKEPGGDPADQQLFNDFFQKYYFPAMSQYSPEALSELGELRYELFRDFLWPATPAIQQQLTDKAYAYCRAVIGKHREFHPAVVYNAVLTLGMLDEQYSTGQSPPKPHGKANDMLCKIVGAAMKDRLPAAMQAGAMVGLERHTKSYGRLDSAEQTATTATLLAAAKQEKFSKDTRKAVRGWLKQQAATAIANIGNAGPKENFLLAIVGLIGDDDLSLDNRCAVAAELSRMNLTQATPPTGQAALEALLKLTTELAAEGRETVTEFEDLLLGRGGRQELELLDPAKFFLVENEVKLQRRGLQTSYYHLGQGLRAIKPLVGDKASVIDSLISSTSNLLQVLNQKDSLDFAIAEELKKVSNEISRIAAQTPAAPAADQPAEAADDKPAEEKIDDVLF